MKWLVCPAMRWAQTVGGMRAEGAPEPWCRCANAVKRSPPDPDVTTATHTTAAARATRAMTEAYARRESLAATTTENGETTSTPARSSSLAGSRKSSEHLFPAGGFRRTRNFNVWEPTFNPNERSSTGPEASPFNTYKDQFLLVKNI